MGPKAKDTTPKLTGSNLVTVAEAPAATTAPPAAATTAPPATPTATPPVTEMDTSTTGSLEAYLDRIVQTSMAGGTISTGIPDLVFHIKCENESHIVLEDLKKGYMIVQGRDFFRKSVFQVNEMSEEIISRVGCGYEGCTVSIADCLYTMSGQILCYKCRSTNSSVEMTEGCEIHEDTKLSTLIFNGLAAVSNFYMNECRKLMAKAVTLPHTTLLNTNPPNGQEQTSTFPISVEQALSLYPWVQTKCGDLLLQLMDGRLFSQLTCLLGLLSQSKAAVSDGSSSAPRSDNKSYFLVESQRLKNKEREYQAQNFKLKKGKRMSAEIVLHQDTFKKRKLNKVGDTTNFDCKRQRYESVPETGGLGTGFTDLCVLQPMYSVNASVNVAPHFLNTSEMHKRDYTATRSYDDDLRCLVCTGERKLHKVLEKGRPLFLFISDQHAPSYIPPQDENCITSVRMSDMSLMDLGTHTIWHIVSEWSKREPKHAVSMDEHGACTLLQMALSRGMNIVLFFSSGSGMTLEGPQGQTFAMARIIQLCNALQFKHGERSLISKVIFPQPLIPAVERPDTTMGPEYNIPKYELECSNAARLMCLNSSTCDKKLGTFISATETVGMDYDLACNDPIREAMPFSCMTKMRGIPNITQMTCIVKTHLPYKMTWPSRDRSHKGALSLKTIGEYCAALHVDILHALNETSYPLAKVDKMIKLRAPFQNLLASVQRWNDEIFNCVSDGTRNCVNHTKHRDIMVFHDKDKHERHTIECYGHVTVKSTPPLVEVDLEDELMKASGSGSGGDTHARGRATRGKFRKFQLNS